MRARRGGRGWCGLRSCWRKSSCSTRYATLALRLLPLDRRGRLRRHVEDHAVDTRNLVHDPGRHRLHEAHPHVRRQAPDVVMRLDRGGDALGAARLDHVGVERTLHEPADVAELPRLLLEEADELAADDLPLLLRLLDAVEQLEESLL